MAQNLGHPLFKFIDNFIKHMDMLQFGLVLIVVMIEQAFRVLLEPFEVVDYLPWT